MAAEDTLPRRGFEPTFDVRRIRRVVTGVDQEGRSTVEYEDESPHLREVAETIAYTEVWTTPSAPPGGERVDGGDVGETLVPEQHGTLFRICEMKPDPEADESREAGEPTGMHTTPTVDYIMVLSGRLTLTLGDGSERKLAPGDVVVQRGTEHAWSVDGPEPAVFAAIIVDAG